MTRSDAVARNSAKLHASEESLGGPVVEPAADSGVQVMRVDSQTGKVSWAQQCAPLNVNHSKYFHQASVRVDGSRLRVTFTTIVDPFVVQ